MSDICATERGYVIQRIRSEDGKVEYGTPPTYIPFRVGETKSRPSYLVRNWSKDKRKAAFFSQPVMVVAERGYSYKSIKVTRKVELEP